MPDDDFMELGSSGLIPAKEGGYIDKVTGHYITAEGVIYNRDGDIIYDPFEEDEYRDEDRDS